MCVLSIKVPTQRNLFDDPHMLLFFVSSGRLFLNFLYIISADDNPCSPGVVGWISNPNDRSLHLISMSFYSFSTSPFDCGYNNDEVVLLKSHAAANCRYSADAKPCPLFENAFSATSNQLNLLPRPADKHKHIKLHARFRTIISGYGRNWLSPFSF